MPLYDLGEHKVVTPGAGRFWVAPTASVIGRVHLGESTSVWFGATIRGDNDTIRIGRRSNVQENAVLHVDPGFPLVVGDEVTIGHLAMLHGCTIEDGALIGIGAIVLNGARIGAGAMIGAGALVPPGKVIPPNTVVMGTPAKVVRDVTDDERAFNKWGVDDYDRRWRSYAGQMTVAG
jgi:carbonic anhydrase/acetyltransferase-like protein (isoleucine patch superfamily)